MFRRFIGWIRQVLGRMFLNNQNVKDVAGDVIVSDEMSRAIDLWFSLYVGNAPWLTEDNRSLGLPAIIASELARLTTLEMQVSVSGSPRAEYINEQLDDVLDHIRVDCEYGCAGGGLMFKPYVDGDKVAVEAVKADAFYPLSFSRGKITAAVFVERKKDGKDYYTRIEAHKLDGTTYTVTNKAYKSGQENQLGVECTLQSVPEWESLAPETVIENIEAPLFAYFKVPLGNTVDMNSPLGVSVYSRAIPKIRDADRIYQGMIWEFEGGELALDVSRDALVKDERGNDVLPVGKERLYRKNDLDPLSTNGDNLMVPWAPALRDESYKNGLNAVLQKIELDVGLAYGTISDPMIVDKTAEEIRSSKQRSASTVTDIQKALQNAFDDLIYAIDVLATLYELAPEGDYETSYQWDDSIVVDSRTEREIDRQDCRDGAMQWWEYRMKWYGEDEETAKRMTGATDQMTDDQLMGFGTGANPNRQNMQTEAV